MSSRGRRTLEEATRGFRYLFALNLASKLLTFAANAFIVRHTAPEQQGARFNLELWVNSALFFSREAFRTAALRRDASAAVPEEERRRNLAACVHVGWAAAAAGAALSVAAGVAFAASARAAGGEWAALGDLSTVIALHFAGAALEAGAEPLFVAAQGLCLFRLRVNVEAGALALRMGATALLVAGGVDALLAFGCAQLLYGAATAGGYWFAFRYTAHRDALACVEGGGAAGRAVSLRPACAVPADLRPVLWQLQLEAAMRLVLTEGEKVVLARWALLATQGVYEVVSHLGSIVCRILFKFLEEAALAAWSKLLAAGAVPEAARVLRALARFLAVLGMVFVCFGPNYSHALLWLLYGQRWVATDAPSLLALYCVYIPVMGVNGVAEAFYRAAAEPGSVWLRRLWRVQTVFSVLYLGTCYLLAARLGYGAHGLICANVCVMLARIAFCVAFMRAFFAEKGAPFAVKEWVPAPTVLAAGFAAYAVTRGSEAAVYQPTPVRFAAHVAVGVVMLAVFAAAVAARERPLLRELRSLFAAKAD